MVHKYRAIISSDWNECLAPCGPFDYIGYSHPELVPALNEIFRQYTGNQISLEHAVQRVNALLPEPVSLGQMDAYLDSAFRTYKGVANLLEWCCSRQNFFMLTTTGAMGYFQRVFAKNLLPRLPAISAYPEPQFSREKTDPGIVFNLFQTTDKGRHTEVAARKLGVPMDRIVLIGDSGGDGPHFKWGAEKGVFLIASMQKPSLQRYCEKEGIQPDCHFGRSYAEGEPLDRAAEMTHDFMDLAPVIEKALDL